MSRYKIIFVLLSVLSVSIKSQDSFFTIDTRKSFYKVSDKFLSVSIDPAVLLAGVNLSDTSLILASHLSPAFIRLSGPSTQFVQYVDNEEEATTLRGKHDKIYVSPSMWFGINEWFKLANLTPVYGINDEDTEKGVWKSQDLLPLLEITDKFEITCYWQLGADCKNKNLVQYIENLNILNQTIRSFTRHNETWKIVGSDLSSCIYDETLGNHLENFIRELDDSVDAVVWQSDLTSKDQLGFQKTSLWTSIPKDSKSINFNSAINWALKIAEVSALRYDVIFREPRLIELTHDTPVYWVTIFHKKLLGTTVLEVKTTHASNISITAHCSKGQHRFLRRGAITLMVINNLLNDDLINIRLGNGVLMEETMEVQSYVLSAATESDRRVALNGELLTVKQLEENVFKPKLRRVKNRGHIQLEVQAETITFFVLTGAKCPLCMENEDDLPDLMQEINNDQKLTLTEGVHFKIEQRMPEFNKNSLSQKTTGLQSIRKSLLQEIELDKPFYDPIVKNVKPNNQNTINRDYEKFKIDNWHDKLKSYVKSKEPTPPGSLTASNLHLTIKEIEEILKNRAKIKAATKNIQLTSSELDLLMDKASLKIPRYFITKGQAINREKRSINMRLLNLKAMLEENEKYLSEYKKHQQSGAGKKTKRDINLDLLKQRSHQDHHEHHQHHYHGKNKIVVQPKHTNNPQPNTSENFDELFGDILHFEEKAFEELLAADDSPKEITRKKPLGPLNLFKNPPLSNRVTNIKKIKDNPSQRFSVQELDLYSYDKSKSPKLIKNQWACIDCEDLNMSEELGHAFFRRKRSHMKSEFKQPDLHTFGKYEPLSSGIKHWKPADILTLSSGNRVSKFPFFSWLNDEDLKNAIIKGKHSTIAKRRKRLIKDTEWIPEINNEIDSSTGINYESNSHQQNINQHNVDVSLPVQAHTERVAHEEMTSDKNNDRHIGVLFGTIGNELKKMSFKVVDFLKDLF
ncbi:hypothetical protein ABEB36_010313 [Hypothenemus hampei]|uniref:Heparanase n=1 Tax=Hypothenemus hampei TaxID=57062 RepID=A0ABD1EJT5_HYPHA